MLALGRKAVTNLDSILRRAMTNLDSILRSRDITLLTEVHSSHVWIWELDHKEGWVLKNWCFQFVVLEKTLESCLDCKDFKPVNTKGNQPWIFTGNTDAEAPIFWPPVVKSQLIGKDPDAGKDWTQEENRATEDEMVGWHHSCPTQWTWVWANSGRRWWTGKPGMLQSVGSQRGRHNWMTSQQQQHN